MRRCKVLRVFTRGDAGGNYLGVVSELSGLDTTAMQEIAVHLSFSETIFLDYEGRETPLARIFTPGAEIPFAGHPLVGAAWVLGNAAPGVVTGIECGIGRVALEASPTTARIEIAPDAVVESAEYSGREVAVQGRLPAPVGAWMVTKGNEYLVIETEDPGAVADADPDFEALRSLPETYLIARSAGRVYARFFAPGLGVPEDPATGSAAVSLAAVRRFEGEPSGALTVEQGAEVGMPSTIELRWDDAAISIGGTVVQDEIRTLDW
jgi:trans-2,3-dihydro-3-hydroxyanthranilate isomerase